MDTKTTKHLIHLGLFLLVALSAYLRLRGCCLSRPIPAVQPLSVRHWIYQTFLSTRTVPSQAFCSFRMWSLRTRVSGQRVARGWPFHHFQFSLDRAMSSRTPKTP